MPTNTPGVIVTPQDTGPDSLWGCAPGFHCVPPKPAGCNIWANPPNFDYLCDAKYCQKSTPFNNVVWPPNSTTWYPPIDGYFNLNPRAFGLDYTIFVEVTVTKIITKHGHTYTTSYTTGDWTSQPTLTHYATASPLTKRALAPPAVEKRTILKRDSSIIPAVCFADCNNCFIEGQRVGMSAALCDPNAAFQQDLQSCNLCVQNNGDPTKITLQTYVDPEFQPFIDFCSVQSAQPAVAASTSTQIVSPLPETSSVVVATQTLPPTSTAVVGVTSQTQAGANTETSVAPIPPSTSTPAPATPAPGSSTPTPTAGELPPSPTSSAGGELTSSTSPAGSGTATTSGPVQVTGSSNTLRVPSFLALLGLVFVFALLSS
jgi:hypothetical protein